MEARSCSKCNFHNHHQKSEIAKHGLAGSAETQKAESSRAKVSLFRSQEMSRRFQVYQTVQGISCSDLQVTAANTDITGDGR